MTDKHFPAFPSVTYQHGELVECNSGLTKREYFAALAMQGFSANPNYFERPDALTADAIAQADSLIAALKKSAREEFVSQHPEFAEDPTALAK